MDRTAPPEGEVHSLGVDWVTVTGRRGMNDLNLVVTAHSILEAETPTPADVRTWHWQRYNGQSTGDVSYGAREDGSILRLSGDQADKHWREALRAADRCTRFDAQVTVRFEPPYNRLGADAYREALTYSKSIERGPTVGAVVTNGHVETVYFGSRKSAFFGRLYDKYAESQEDRYLNCWRYEVEVKEDLATQLARRLYHHDHPYAGLSAFVHDWFTKRGHRPRYPRGDGAMRVARTHVEDDDERVLRWYREQVGPTLAALSSRGKRGEALRALGILAEVVFTEAEHPR